VTTHKMPRRGAIIELEDMTPEYKVHKNLTQDVILTTQDKLRLALIEHRDVLAGKREWISAGSLALSLLSTLLLTTFEDKLGLSSSTWQAMYALFFVFALIWLTKSLLSLYKNRKKREIDYLINEIKETSPQ
jgi:hypothetical protein